MNKTTVVCAVLVAVAIVASALILRPPSKKITHQWDCAGPLDYMTCTDQRDPTIVMHMMCDKNGCVREGVVK